MITNLNRERVYVPGLVAMLALALVAGCSYPKVGSDAYDVAMALDQMFQQQDVQKLELANQLVASKFQAGEITSQEERYFQELLLLASNHRWQDASQNCRKLLKDQVIW
jgi:hypothetical protein